MASLPKDEYLSPEEYLAIERKGDAKSEYLDGVMYLMSGALPEHNVIVGNLIAELNVRLRTVDCGVYPSNLRVRTPDSRAFFYPDVSVICGQVKLSEGTRDVALNPILVIEVLSDSTVAFDRGEKFQRYQQIESLKELVLVTQDEMTVETFVRQPNSKWRYTKASGADAVVALASLDCQIPIRDIYHKVL